MKITVRPSIVNGSIEAPSSKSITHRAIMCSLQAEGISNIKTPLYCDDTLATIEACRQLGATIHVEESSLEVIGTNTMSIPKKVLWCGGSASTMRMLMGVSSRVNGYVTLSGDGTLLNRPIASLVRSLEDLGAVCSMPRMGYPPVTIDGRGFKGGETILPGNESSQFLSSLLLSVPSTGLGAQIEVSPQLESAPYVDLTVSVLEKFGIIINHEKNYGIVDVPGKQTFKPHDMKIEGDYSSAAFLLAAGALVGEVTVKGLNKDTAQGDGEIIDILRKFGADIIQSNNKVTVKKSNLSPIEINCTDIPDIVPIIASLATQAKGTTVLHGIDRLRIKESDRVASISEELNKMGARISSTDNDIIIDGPTQLHGAYINSHEDHRIAMSCAVMALVSSGPVMINDSECINKSYPGFIRDLRSIGGDVDGA